MYSKSALKRIVIVLGLLLTVVIDAQVLIFTYAYNRPDFIEMQDKLFKKFLKDDYEFVVFSDARTNDMAQAIERTCSTLGLRCIRFPQHLHNRPYLPRWPQESYHAPAVRNCNIVQYSLNEYGFKHDDIVVLFDSDLFLVKEFSFREHLHDYDLASAKIGWGWLWIGYLMLDMRTMPRKETFNVNCGRVDNKPVDAGGHTILYMRENPDIKVHFSGISYVGGPVIDKIALSNGGFNAIDARFLAQLPNGINMEYLEKGTFLHYRGGTNWDHKSAGYHNQKTSLLQQYVNDLIAS